MPAAYPCIMPLQPGQLALWKACGCQDPGCLVFSHLRKIICEVGNRAETATGQDILEIASTAQQVQQEQAPGAVLQAKPPPQQLPIGRIGTAALVPLSTPPPGQPARDCIAQGSRRVGAAAHSEATYTDNQVHTCIQQL